MNNAECEVVNNQGVCRCQAGTTGKLCEEVSFACSQATTMVCEQVLQIFSNFIGFFEVLETFCKPLHLFIFIFLFIL